MTHRNVLSLAAIVVSCSMFLLPNLASAQPDAGTDEEPAGETREDPLGDCFRECAALYSEEAEAPEGDAEDDTMDDLIARCRAQVPACRSLDETAMRAVGDWCGRASSRRARSSGSAVSPTAETPSFCIMPDGTTATDDGRRRCGCPAGTLPMAVSVHRSSDRLRSLEVPRGHRVFVCANPLALRGEPGSVDERGSALAATVAVHDAGLRALCAPDEGEELAAACAEARAAFLAAGSGDGPVDLAPVLSAIAEIREIDARQDRDIVHLGRRVDSIHREVDGDLLGMRASIIDVAASHSALVQCLRHPEADFRISFTAPDGTVEEISCPELLANASPDDVGAAEREVREIVREEISHLTEGGRAFAWLGAFGLVTFNPFTDGNGTYGNLWALGGELSMGVNLGGGWVAVGGVGLGGSGPDIEGVSNVLGLWRLGVGAFVVPELLLTGGLTGLHRFRPDVFAAESIYGAYVDANIRFLPRGEWSPVLSLRLGVGASPRIHGDVWQAEANGYAQGIISIAHF